MLRSRISAYVGSLLVSGKATLSPGEGEGAAAAAAASAALTPAAPTAALAAAVAAIFTLSASVCSDDPKTSTSSRTRPFSIPTVSSNKPS
eukprot:CAMPEP_0173346100 /NCGR_PEP_ID=MMETSP1144-20121109/12376_1 /TAXON_ID=483371 /ORGANISM="non described non described, Strain CCMP2298" /LENGTH=89 /DNA_ID=CAMNT_0014293369 /DNA_START=504 /DNA_END=773 /DNA_ORIENTATION=+